MDELAHRAARTGIAQVAWFLSPAEQAQAEICARRAGVTLFSEGGTPDAERRVVAFAEMDWLPEWPVDCLRVTWHARYGALGHRDLLGAILALGMGREKVGDLYIGDGEAHLFVLHEMAGYIAANLERAGNTPVKVAVLDAWPSLDTAGGDPVTVNVASPRLDAVLGAAWKLSRGRAAQLVASGSVKVNHQQELRADRQVNDGAVISVRGKGRVKVESIGGQSKKGRFFMTLLRFCMHL